MKERPFARIHLVLALLVLLNLLGAALVPPWMDDDTRRRIEATGVVRVGLDPAYPPFEMEQEGQIVGFDIDLAQALAGQMGVQVQLVPMGYDSLYDALVSGEIDLILSSYPYSPELCRRERCTQPYFQAGQVLVVRAGSEIDGPRALRGKRVGVEMGGAGDSLVQPWERAGIISRRVAFLSPGEALEALLAGDVDAAVVDRISALAFVLGRGGVEIRGPVLQDESFVAVVARRSVWLHHRLQRALRRLAREGTLSALEARWCSEVRP
ncbi:MAG: ABC transporter substrate-binding protein [Chloroflexia bacterium]